MFSQQRHRSPGMPLAGLGMVLIWLMLIPATALAAPLDTVTGNASRGSSRGGVFFFTVSARSDTSGQRPTGQVSELHFGGGDQPNISGPVTCLKVTGKTAVINFDGTAQIATHVFPVGIQTLQLVSNGGRGHDRFAYNGGPIETGTRSRARTDCSPLNVTNPNFSGTLDLGTVAIFDAPPLKPVMISNARFVGGPRNPKIIIDGENFGLSPAPDPAGGTSNLGKCGPIAGNTGIDFGTSLWIDDHTQLWSAGYLPYVDCMGLILTRYSDDRIVYRLGSFYRINYAHRNGFAYGIYKLAKGDQVTVNVKGAQFSTRVSYDHHPQ